MTRRGKSLSRLVVVNRALLDVVDRLQAEFPEVPLLVVYGGVTDARALATRHLPNVAAFSDAVERRTRTQLCARAGNAQPVGCP
jgi:hypothetical protein